MEISVSAEEVGRLANYVREKPDTYFEVDLIHKMIKYDDEFIEFDMPDGRRQAFLHGIWDAMSLLQQNSDKVSELASKLPYADFRTREGK